MSIRCKMKLENVFANTYGGAKAIFRCEYDSKLCEEDRAFQKATPSGTAEFQIDNPKAAEQLVIGRYYYVDFISTEEWEEFKDTGHGRERPDAERAKA